MSSFMSIPREVRARIYREAAYLNRQQAAITMQRLIRARQARLRYIADRARLRILNRAVGGGSSRARRLMMMSRHGRGGRYNWGN